MAMRSLSAGAGRSFVRTAVRSSEPPVLAKATTIGAPIRALQPPILTNAASMGTPFPAGQKAVLHRALAMGAPLRAAEAPAMGASIRAGLNTKVGMSLAANAAASTRVAAGRVLAPTAAPRVSGDRSWTQFAARGLSTATNKPPSGGSKLRDALIDIAVGGACAVVVFTVGGPGCT